MTQKKYFSLALTIVYVLLCLTASAGSNQDGNGRGNHTGNEAAKQTDMTSHAKHMPVSKETHSNVPHGKAQTPHAEELPHIHKFHKERVKKVRRHRTCWLLSQVLLFICHASVLYISYLHVVH